jgi:uncharacterized protein (UPF0332 family)
MSHEENKLNWCLKKAAKEVQEGKKHRGLIKVKINIEEIKKHIAKAEHNLKAISYFDEGGFSDWSMSAVFYCIYHCFLAIALKFGYESRNQECTVALMKVLKLEGKIELNGKFIDALGSYSESERHESNIIENRENYTYGTSVSVKDEGEIRRAISLCQECLDETKDIIFK